MCAVACAVFLNKRFLLVRVFGFGNIEVSMSSKKTTQRSGSKLGRQVTDNLIHLPSLAPVALLHTFACGVAHHGQFIDNSCTQIILHFSFLHRVQSQTFILKPSIRTGLLSVDLVT